MEKSIVFIKQTHSSFSRGVIKQTTDTGDVFALHPNSFRFYYPRKNRKGQWITGLTEDETKKYSDILGIDLNPYSSFWETYRMVLISGRTEITFNLNNPEEYIKYKCALANKYIAEKRDDLMEGIYHEEGCFLYVDDPEGDLRKENELAELKDEITSKIFLMKNQKEKMFLILSKTGKIVNESWNEGLLYKMLRSHVEECNNNKEKLQHFLDILEIDNYTLQVEYNVNKALTSNKKQVIKIVNGQYIFGDKVLGSNKAKAIEYFMKNEDMFQLLLEEMLE